MSVLIKDFKIPTGDEPRMFLTHFNEDGTADMIAMGYPQKPYSLVEVPDDGVVLSEDEFRYYSRAVLVALSLRDLLVDLNSFAEVPKSIEPVANALAGNEAEEGNP